MYVKCPSCGKLMRLTIRMTYLALNGGCRCLDLPRAFRELCLILHRVEEEKRASDKVSSMWHTRSVDF